MLLLAFNQPIPPDPCGRFPPLEDARVFPDFDFCSEQVIRYREHRLRLGQLAFAYPDRREDFQNWDQQVHGAIVDWNLIRDAVNPNSSELNSRVSLWHLKRSLGEDGYYHGKTPPVIPADLWPPLVPLPPPVSSNPEEDD
jgi:hypothetical protein